MISANAKRLRDKRQEAKQLGYAPTASMRLPCCTGNVVNRAK